jgi:hypothetical protein
MIVTIPKGNGVHLVNASLKRQAELVYIDCGNGVHDLWFFCVQYAF